MRAIRRINNNAAICVDGKGNELVALGQGVGFGKLPREVPLAQISRTFYRVDEKYLALIGELPEDVLEFSAQLAEVCRSALSYELSPNLPITLADHVAFMLERARKHMVVQMPLAYEVQQAHPLEYRLAEAAVRGARKTFRVRIDRNEAAGIALSIINSAISASERAQQREEDAAFLIEAITRIVEDEMGVTVDRESFDFARFATHVRYLIDRVLSGEPIATQNQSLFNEIAREYPKALVCAERSSAAINDRLRMGELTEEEQLYLMLHVNRISERLLSR